MKYIYMMKINKSIVLLAFSLLLISCNKDESKQEKEENNVLKTELPESFERDSITYYNGNQQKIDISLDQYFGFGFMTEGQELEWELDSILSPNLAYVSEIYEASTDTKKEIKSGKQFYTFQANKKGIAKIKFKSKLNNQSKVIEINIK